jgi:hypothetical protein
MIIDSEALHGEQDAGMEDNPVIAVGLEFWNVGKDGNGETGCRGR